MDHPRSSPNLFMIEHSIAQNLETQREEKGPGVYTLRLSQLFYTIQTLKVIYYGEIHNSYKKHVAKMAVSTPNSIIFF